MEKLYEFYVYRGDSNQIAARFFSKSIASGKKLLEQFFVSHRDCYCGFAGREDPLQFMSFYYTNEKLHCLNNAIVLSKKEADTLT